jgi:8-oxo-dGTP pyrophosphatase MutT (NUDIX family)
MGSPRVSRSLPLQVAAVCYRKRGTAIEFLLVKTNGGSKWTFPKGSIEAHLSHSQAAQREAFEEAGALGVIESRHFHLYLHCKGVFWQPAGVQEFVVKAFLLEVTSTQKAPETTRDPTWFSASEAREILGKGREVKYGAELQRVVDQALEHIRARKMVLTEGPESRPTRAHLR